MKLLIVDDEKLTRTGIAHSLDWQAFGIDEVLEASNGERGLALVKEEHPEIILSDVRMPKMDGIRMAEAVQQLYPESIIIFMSGYSDTEYLKAAIRLRAVNYVEKPVDPEELKKAVKTAADTFLAMKRTKRTSLQEQLEKHSRLTLNLLQPVTQASRDLSHALGLFETAPLFIATFILQLNVSISTIQKELFEEYLEKIDSRLHSMGLSQIHAQTHDRNLILHVFSSHEPDPQTLRQAAQYMGSLFGNVGTYSLSVGKTVSSMEDIHISYESAAVLLQSAFTCPCNSILIYGDSEKLPDSIPQDFRQEFRQALHQRDKERALLISEALFKDFSHCHSVIPSQIKDSYYRYFMLIKDSLSGSGVLDGGEDPLPDTWNRIFLCSNLLELKKLLDLHIERHFEALESAPAQNPTVFMVKDFISRHYTNETLSIQDISDYVHLSPAYLCTLFKGETGVTINQYLTELRMARAKDMLTDPRYKITDISSGVGYSDSGYFAKSFKKTVGLSPSEYREKMQQ